MNEKNYIGITGFKTVDEIQRTKKFFNALGVSKHCLMIGILISPRNHDPTWYSTRYPKLAEFPDLVNAASDGAFVTLHLDSKNSRQWDKDLIELMKNVEKENVGGFQINVKHPTVEMLKNVKESFPDHEIIMQYSNDFLNLDVKDAKDEFMPYASIVDHVLIDPSRGAGIVIDLKSTIPHYSMLTSEYGVNVGFAGGFRPDNITSMLEVLIQVLNHDRFSIDIETGVRDTHDMMILEKVTQYLSRASMLLK